MRMTKYVKVLILVALLTLGLSTSLCAQQVNRQAALTTTVSVQGTMTHFYGYYIYNPNASACSLDLFNVLSAAVVLGTTTPYMSIVIPATSAANLYIPTPSGVVFPVALSEAAVTAAGGGSTCGTGMTVNLLYQ